MISLAGDILVDIAVAHLLRPLAVELGRQALRQATRGVAGARAEPGVQSHGYLPALRQPVPDQPEKTRSRPRLGLVAQTSIVSQTPGRVRLRVNGLQGEPARAADLEARLRRLAGVTAATASPLTGNLLVRYDPDRISADQIRATLEAPAWNRRPSYCGREPTRRRRPALVALP